MNSDTNTTTNLNDALEKESSTVGNAEIISKPPSSDLTGESVVDSENDNSKVSI